MQLRRLMLVIGWSALVIMPLAIGLGYFQAMWIYSRGFPPTLGAPRWGHMALIIAGGAVLSVAVGAMLSWLLNSVSNQPMPLDLDAAGADVCQRCEEREVSRPPSQNIQPAVNNFQELSPNQGREYRGRRD